MQKITILDAEIKKAIPNKSEPLIEGIEYCGGWTDYENMGISVMGAYDYAASRYRVFCDDNKDEFIELIESSDLIVSFNGWNFDSKLMAAVWGHAIQEEKHFDILRQLRLALELNPITGSFRKGLNLNALMKANFDIEKTGSGALAPIDWQRGKLGTVIDYCLNDIGGTKLLFEKICIHEKVIDPISGEEIHIKAPLVGKF